MITKIQLELIDLNGDGFHLSLKASLNNKPIFLILDTGASHTVFDVNRIGNYVDQPDFETNEQLSTGLGTNSMESNIFIADSFMLGEMKINDYRALAIDMQHINQTYEMLDLPLIDGVLGGDILMDFKARIDYKNLILSLNFPKAKYYNNYLK